MNSTRFSIACIAMIVLAPCAIARPQSDLPEDAPKVKQTPVRNAPGGASGGAKRSTVVLRRPLIDLEAMAKARRDGQIMPGDPAPGASAVIDLPTADRALEAAPAPVAITRPAPKAAERAAAARVMPPDSAPAIAPGTTEPLPELPKQAATASVPAAEATLSANTPAIATDIQPRRDEAEAASARAAEAAAREEQAARQAEAREIEMSEAKPVAEVVRVAPPAPVPAARSASAADVGAAVTAQEPPAVTVLGPARVRVMGTSGSGSVEWRHADTPWTQVTTGATAEGRVEVRAAMDADTRVIVEDRVEVRVGRLCRAIIETAAEADGTKTVHIGLARGMIEVRSIGEAGGAGGWSRYLARVRTPDRSVALIAPSSVEYDAFAGAKVRIVNSEP